MGGVDNFLSLGHSFAYLDYGFSRGPVLPAMLKMISTNLQIFGWKLHTMIAGASKSSQDPSHTFLSRILDSPLKRTGSYKFGVVIVRWLVSE